MNTDFAGAAGVVPIETQRFELQRLDQGQISMRCLQQDMTLIYSLFRPVEKDIRSAMMHVAAAAHPRFSLKKS